VFGRGESFIWGAVETQGKAGKDSIVGSSEFSGKNDLEGMVHNPWTTVLPLDMGGYSIGKYRGLVVMRARMTGGKSSGKDMRLRIEIGERLLTCRKLDGGVKDSLELSKVGEAFQNLHARKMSVGKS